MVKNNQYWIKGVPWYNTYICKNYTEQCLNNLLEIKELTNIISCVILMHNKKSIHHPLIMAAAVVVIRYHQIQQHKHYIHSAQPSI